MRCALLFLSLLALGADRPDIEAPRGFWKRLGPPQKGGWRDRFPEPGQTLTAYKASSPSRPTTERTRIYLQPCLTRAPSDPRLLERIAAHCAGFFGREVSVLEPRGLPRRAYDLRRRQFSIMRLFPHLRRMLPRDGLFLLAVTDRDLHLPKMQYVFGWGSFEHRVGIMSLRRTDVGKEALSRRRRVLGLAVHEASHLLSMAHCVFYRCLMNGARTLKEADERPLLLCPECRAKLCWNLGLGPLERYRKLASALEQTGLHGEAVQTRRAARETRRHGGA